MVVIEDRMVGMTQEAARFFQKSRKVLLRAWVPGVAVGMEKIR